MADVTLEFRGEKFAVAEQIGWMPMMRFARLSENPDTELMEGLAGLHAVLQECIAERDWPRFEAHATKVHADYDDLYQMVADAIAVMTARPTSQPSDSSDGPSPTSGPSADGSGSPVTSLVERLEREGRPSIAYMVQQAQASRASG